MNNEFEWIWFDICNTLVDVDNYRFVEDLSKLIPDLNGSQILQIIYSEGIVESFELGELSIDDVYNWFVLRFRGGLLDFSLNDFSLLWCKYSACVDYVIATLVGLSKFYKIGLASNIDPLFFRHVLDICPDLNVTTSRILSYDIGCRKPDRRFFEEILIRSGCLAHKIVFIDDDLENISVAKDLEMRVVLSGEREDIRQNLKNIIGLII